MTRSSLTLLALACLALGASAFLPTAKPTLSVTSTSKRSLPSLPSRSRSTTTKMSLLPELAEATTTVVAVTDFAEVVGEIGEKVAFNPWLKFLLPFSLGCMVGLVVNAFIIYTAWYIPPETMKGWQQVDDDTMNRVMSGGENWEDIVKGSGGKYQPFPDAEPKNTEA